MERKYVQRQPAIDLRVVCLNYVIIWKYVSTIMIPGVNIVNIKGSSFNES